VETTFAKKKDIKERKCYLIDATDKILGRLATRVATILMGKHKPIYTPFLDTGDFVIVINAAKVKLSGRKLDKKVYQRFSGYPGGRREIPLGNFIEKNPAEVVKLAVKRMLPKTALARQMFTKLRVYPGQEHPHQAQQPIVLKI